MQSAGKSAILKKSFPLIICELTDAMMLFSGVAFLTLEDEVYLAAIGLIDAFLLCCLAYGFALSDAFRNFYARRKEQDLESGVSASVLQGSKRTFLLSALIVSTLGTVCIMAVNLWFSAEIVRILISALPLLISVVVVYYIGLSYHAFLIGNGHLHKAGYIALSAFFLHLILLYTFLHVIDTGMLPTNAVLAASLVAESFWLALLWAACRKSEARSHSGKFLPHVHRIGGILRRAAFLPALSVCAFHFAVAGLFLYLTWCCAHGEAAALTLAMSYYALLIAPVNGISDAAANGFSHLHARRREALFPRFRKNLFAVSLASAAAVFAVVQVIGLSSDTGSGEMMLFIGVLAVFGMRNKIDFTAVLVRLRTGLFFKVQFFSALAVVIGFLLLRDFFALQIVALLVVVLLAQAAVAVAMQQKVRAVWFAR